MTAAPERRQSRVSIADVILALARIYRSSAEAASQAVENETDAGATKVWVVLEDDKLMVIGNGHGMVPHMLQGDRDMVDMFFDLEAKGEIRPGDDIREDVGPTSKHSLEWMMTCIALSSKIPGESKDIRGMRGIGSFAYLQYAKEARLTTRPTLDLYRQYRSDNQLGEAPTFLLEPPSFDRLKNRKDASFAISDSPVELLDPWGNRMDQGTRFEAIGIKPDDESLRPNALAAFLRGRYGDDIRKKRYQLTVVDRTSTEGRMTKGGRLIELTPPSYKGILIVDEVLYAQHGVPFQTTLYYDPNGRILSPMVRRQNVEVCKLVDLTEFQKPPWDNGKIGGYVDFPQYPNDDDLWDSGKTQLLSSPQRNQWEKRLLSLARTVRERIEEIDTHSRTRQTEELGREVTLATAQAMSEVDFFKDLTFGAVEKPRKKKPSVARRIPDYVTARVFDEHSRGVSGITIELWQGPRLIVTKETGLSGAISFGKQPPGRGYRAKMLVPKPYEPLGPQQYPFDLEERAGYAAIFRVVTGRQAPRLPDVKSIAAVFRALDDPEIPYQQRLDVGLLVFNTIAPDLAQAISEGREETQRSLLAAYAAAAVTEYCAGESDPKFALVQSSLLFARLLQNMGRTRAAKQPASKNRR